MKKKINIPINPTLGKIAIFWNIVTIKLFNIDVYWKILNDNIEYKCVMCCLRASRELSARQFRQVVNFGSV